jgi:hypothetical protein
VLRALDYDSATDLAYLKELYYTHLAPRKCTDTVQCKTFARKQDLFQCVVDRDFSEGWLGGDDEETPPVLGRVGGCMCTEGFMVHPCVHCIEGYGPATAEERLAYQEFFNTTDEPEYCSLPWVATTTRQTGVCGGRGEAVVTKNDTLADFTINVFEGNRTHRCPSLLWGPEETVLTLNQTAAYTIGVLQYWPWLHVIDGRVFVNGTEYVVTATEGDVVSFLGGDYARCVRWLDSATDHVEWVGHRILDSSFDFWLAKVVRYW